MILRDATIFLGNRGITLDANDASEFSGNVVVSCDRISANLTALIQQAVASLANPDAVSAEANRHV